MIGDKDHPIRVSSFPMLVRCPRRTMLQFMSLLDETSGEAAQTGTLVGAAIESWHKIGEIEAAFDDAVQRTLADCPDADHDLVKKMLEGYCSDPRNAPRGEEPKDSRYGIVELESLEAMVEFKIPPHDWDYTREPIVCRGHLDQIRFDKRSGRYFVWDVKAGRRLGGPVLLSEHALQIAGYVVGAEIATGQEMHPGGIIRVADYAAKTNPGPVFYEAPYTRDDCFEMLDSVKLAVALARTGKAPAVPNEACQWGCIGGPAQCLPLLRAGAQKG